MKLFSKYIIRKSEDVQVESINIPCDPKAPVITSKKIVTTSTITTRNPDGTLSTKTTSKTRMFNHEINENSDDEEEMSEREQVVNNKGAQISLKWH